MNERSSRRSADRKPARRRRVATVTMSCAALGIGLDDAASQEGEREFVSFLWAAGIQGREGLGGRVIDVDADFGDLLDFVDVGASFRYRATRDGLGWFLEADYTRLDSDVAAPAAPASAELTAKLGELGFARAFTDTLSLYAGLRAQSLEIELRAPPDGLLDGDSSWVDGMVGLRWVPIRSGPWVAWVRGDIGAGESDRVWLAEAGGGFRFGSAWTAYVAYRTLSTDYEDDGLVYDVEQSGIAFGFGFTF